MGLVAAQHQPESPPWQEPFPLPPDLKGLRKSGFSASCFSSASSESLSEAGRPWAEHFGAQAARCWLALRAVSGALDTHTDTDQKELDSVFLDPIWISFSRRAAGIR